MKRLYRSNTDKQIAGICGGLAAYTDTDPTLWRLGMVFLAVITGGLAFIGYLIAIIIIPPEPETPTKAKKA